MVEEIEKILRDLKSLIEDVENSLNEIEEIIIKLKTQVE